MKPFRLTTIITMYILFLYSVIGKMIWEYSVHSSTYVFLFLTSILSFFLFNSNTLMKK